MGKIKPLKRFGQHFLTDQNIINKIVVELEPGIDDLLVEIGPGQGALTEKLYKKVKNFIAVEIDSGRSKELIARFPLAKIINEDFLEVDLKKIGGGTGKKMRIIGNIPYNLTSPIIFKLLNNTNLVIDAVLMMQLEVAKRITAKKDTKDYGILTVILNRFARVKFCFRISPNVFYPKPKVSSALVHIRFIPDDSSKEFRKIFIELVKAAFGSRRKTLKNSLNNSKFKELDFSDSGIDLSLRAENLSVIDYQKLTEFTLNYLDQSGFKI